MTFLVWSQDKCAANIHILSLPSRRGTRPRSSHWNQSRLRAGDVHSWSKALQPPAMRKILPGSHWCRQRNSQSRPDRGKHVQTSQAGRPAAITGAREECCCPEPQNEYTQRQGGRTLTVQSVLGTEMMLIMTKMICANSHLRPRMFQPRLFTDGNPKEPSERSTSISIPILVAKGKLRVSPEVPKQTRPEEPALLRAPSCPWPPPAPVVCHLPEKNDCHYRRARMAEVCGVQTDSVYVSRMLYVMWACCVCELIFVSACLSP